MARIDPAWQIGGVFAHPRGAHPPGKLAVVLAPGDHVYLAPAMPGDLDHHVGRRAEAVEGQLSAGRQMASPKRPIADDAGAQQRRGLDVAQFPLLLRKGWGERGQRINEIGRRNGILGVSAVGVVAGEAGRFAKVFLPFHAETALAARVPQPRRAHPLTQTELRFFALPIRKRRPELVDQADDLMAGDDRRFLRRQIAFDHVEISAADGATTHADAAPRPGPARASADRPIPAERFRSGRFGEEAWLSWRASYLSNSHGLRVQQRHEVEAVELGGGQNVGVQP